MIQTLKLCAKDILQLTDCMKRKQNKFISQDIHNEIIQIIANQITCDIAANIRNNFYSIMYDEYTDISNKEQLSFYIRWVNKFLVAHEEFLGFYEVPNIKSETLVKIIKDILLHFQLSLQVYFGQCFNVASNMLGKRSGVAIQNEKEHPKAHYTHCHCHFFNLRIKGVTRSSKILSDVMDTSGKISVLIVFSPKREKLLENLREQVKNSKKFTPNKITKMSTTRWTARVLALLRIIENYSYIMELWNKCLVNENLTTEIKSQVTGFQGQISKFDLFFGLHIEYRLYSYTDNLSKSLQSEKKCLLPLVNDWQTSLSHCFNQLELRRLSNLFTMLF